jgi:hypothetical protein
LYRWGLALMPASVSVRASLESGADGVLTRNRNRLKPVSHPDAAEGWN